MRPYYSYMQIHTIFTSNKNYHYKSEASPERDLNVKFPIGYIGRQNIEVNNNLWECLMVRLSRKRFRFIFLPLNDSNLSANAEFSPEILIRLNPAGLMRSRDFGAQYMWATERVIIEALPLSHQTPRSIKIAGSIHQNTILENLIDKISETRYIFCQAH